jgi:DNA-binding MarR family transcriptional regulator
MTNRKTPSASTEVSRVTEAVLVASRALVGVAARSIAVIDSDVTLPQYRALVVLHARGEQNVGVLSDLLGIHPSSATRLCDRLAAKKLVRRSIAPDSRREVILSLTAKGHALVRKVTDVRRAEIARVVGRIPAELRPAMVSALLTFAEAAGEVSAEAWTLGWT